jgi:hypothetical protein
VAVQLHLVVKFEMTLLDGPLDPHPEDPAVVDGVRIPIMEAAVTFLLYSIGRSMECPSGNLIRPSFTRNSNSLQL